MVTAPQVRMHTTAWNSE